MHCQHETIPFHHTMILNMGMNKVTGFKQLSSTATDTALTTEQRQELMLPGLSKSEALWNQAFAAIRRKEPGTIQEYEEALCPGTGTLSPAERMGEIVRQNLHDHDLKALSISLLGKSFKIRQIGESIITFIYESKGFITTAASTEPHLALAWSGVSFLLPVSFFNFVNLGHSVSAE